MPETFGGVWRKVRLRVPLAPPLLVQDWVKTAAKILGDESNWSFLRAEGEFHIGPSKSGTATLTEGSATVTSAGGAAGITFAASDVGRQLLVSGGPPISILSVALAPPTSCVLERAWQGATATPTVTVADLYATCPEDFGHFIAVLDPQNQRPIRIFMTSEELNAADPGRAATGTPWALVNYRLSALAATEGRVLYEWWPYWAGTASLRFPFYYFKRPPDMGDDDYFQGPLRDRTDVIVDGALMLAAEWPGTALQRNPYFNLNLSKRLEGRYAMEMGKLEVKDQELYMTWLQDQWWSRSSTDGMGVGPTDANFMQSHE